MGILEEYKIKKDPRYRQCNKETCVTLLIFAIFGILNLLLVYFLGVAKPPTEYGWVLGFPDWLFYGVFVLAIIYFIVICLVIKYVYKELPLGSEEGS